MEGAACVGNDGGMAFEVVGDVEGERRGRDEEEGMRVAVDDGDDVIQGGGEVIDDNFDDADQDNDTISGGAGNDLIQGNQGDDTIAGDAGADTISGGTGNDLIDGGADNDTMIGGAGDDTLRGEGGEHGDHDGHRPPQPSSWVAHAARPSRLRRWKRFRTDCGDARLTSQALFAIIR